AAVDGIDAIVTGHHHLVFPCPKSWDGVANADPVKGTLHGKPAVVAGEDRVDPIDGGEMQRGVIHLFGWCAAVDAGMRERNDDIGA
ncbi:hypothetical protein ACC740_37615, partial [Rhizobium ruizarguesonis]